MTKTFEEITGEEVFDIRDVIERYEEIEDIGRDDDETEEFKAMQKFLDEVKGNGGDEQWRGDWYPVTFIEDGQAFETYMDQMLEDCGDMQACDKIPAYLTITVNYDMLKWDYTPIEVNAKDFLYR